MENLKKQLKTLSILLFILVIPNIVLSVITLMQVEALAGIDLSDPNAVLAAKTLFYVAGAIAIALSLCKAGIAIKGFCESRNPLGAKGYITFALVLGVLTAISTISGLTELFNTKELIIGIVNVVLGLVETVVLFAFVSGAKKLNALYLSEIEN